MANKDVDVLGQLLQEVFSDRDGAKRLLEYLLNQAMRAEVVGHVGVQPHERSGDRQGYRNGYKPRTIKLSCTSLIRNVLSHFSSRFSHPRILFWSPLDEAWFKSIRSFGVHDQDRQFG